MKLHSRIWLFVAVFIGVLSSRSTTHAESPPPFVEGGFDGGMRCVRSEDCGCAFNCVGGFCIAQSVPDRCNVDADCLACTGRVCAAGRCLTPTARPSCAGQVCTGCDVCLERVGCTPPDQLLCANAADCGPGADCVGAPVMRCVRRAIPPTCANDTDCVPCTGTLCVRGTCFRQAQNPMCRSDSECPGCSMCLPRIGCIPASVVTCQNDGECGESFRCRRMGDNSRCGATEYGDLCRQNSDCNHCNPLLQCVQGACVIGDSGVAPNFDSGVVQSTDAAMDGGTTFDAASDAGSAAMRGGCSVGAPRATRANGWQVALVVAGLSLLRRKRQGAIGAKG